MRASQHRFILDGIQSLRAALEPKEASAPLLELIYVTQSGLEKLQAEFSPSTLSRYETIMVSEQVMNAMAETETPQGILAICKYLPSDLARFENKPIKKVAYFWHIQDPGNAGTAVRTADACGFDLVILSENSVDLYSPKVIRSTAGSLWNIPVVVDVTLNELVEFSKSHAMELLAFDGNAEKSFMEVDPSDPVILVFGNEGQGLPELAEDFIGVNIPMKGHTESFNVASAAAIAMYHFS